jgi:hypothetical protein
MPLARDGRIWRATIEGTVAAAEPGGGVSVQSPLGPLKIWASAEDVAVLPPGSPVTVWIAVQALDVERTGGERLISDAAALPLRDLRNASILVGRVRDSAGGRITVQAPGGEIAVWAAGEYAPGALVQVWTALEPGCPICKS